MNLNIITTMIKINKITPQEVDLYAPDGTHLGKFNEYEFLDAKAQIKEGQEPGYYAMYNGSKIRIDRNGTQEHYPIGMFDMMTDLYMRLM